MFRINGDLNLEEEHKKNDFAKGSKILLDTDLKIILLDHQKNFIKIISDAVKNFDILVTSFGST